MISFKLYFSLILLLNVSKNSSDKDVVIFGEARDAKAGAIVISIIDKRVYYIDGVDYWDPKIYGKKVKVSGKLLIENIKMKPAKKGIPVAAQIVGIKRTILNPKWELTK